MNGNGSFSSRCKLSDVFLFLFLAHGETDNAGLDEHLEV